MNILNTFARFINSDRYQYTESDVFMQMNSQHREAVFDFFFRRTEDGGFAVVAGVESVLRLVESLNNTAPEEKYRYFKDIIEEPELLRFLCSMRFEGNIYAMREGELAFPGEPVIVVEGGLVVTKLLETPLLNALNYQMAIASKASRVSRAAGSKTVLAFGPRRAHGFDASVMGSRAALIGGCGGHSALATEYFYNEKSAGTMSHSYIQAFGIGSKAELEAFIRFIEVRRTRRANALLLLIDTYETLQIGIKNAVAAFKQCGIDDSYPGLYGVRIDSGDLAYLSKQCRLLLDEAGFKKAVIVLTNSLDEDSILNLIVQETPFDIIGVGDAIAVSRDNPCFGGVYKMVRIDGKPVIKVSNDVIKSTTPHRKEIYRIYQNGEAKADLITLAEDDANRDTLLKGGEITIVAEHNRLLTTTFAADSYTVRPLLYPMVLNGKLTEEGRALADTGRSRQFYKENLLTFSEERRRLLNPHYYKVDLSDNLYKLKMQLIKEAKIY
jgi:nicotinate phosphoribosyltransferase